MQATSSPARRQRPAALLAPAADRDYRRMSKIVRDHIGARAAHCPIYTVDGWKSPELLGRSYHWTTPGGCPVYHPSAYARAYGRPVYHGSTLRIVVGRGWLLRALLRAEVAEGAAKRRARLAVVRQRKALDRAARSARMVYLADALKAGLCETGTRQWCAAAGLDAERGATLADVVAAYRRSPRPEVIAVVRAALGAARKPAATAAA